MAEIDLNKIVEKLNLSDKKSLADSLFNSMNDEQKKTAMDIMSDENKIKKFLDNPEVKAIYDFLKKKG